MRVEMIALANMPSRKVTKGDRFTIAEPLAKILERRKLARRADAALDADDAEKVYRTREMLAEPSRPRRKK